MFVALAKIFD